MTEGGLDEVRFDDDGLSAPQVGALKLWLGLTRRVRRVSVGAIEGRHGAEPNLAVSPRRRAAHGAGHACRDIILAIVAFVYRTIADANIVTRRRRGCFFARIAALRL